MIIRVLFPFVRNHAMPSLIAVAFAVAAFPWLTLPQTGAVANHAWPANDAKHLYYQHWDTSQHGFYDEDYCVDDIGGTIGDSVVASMVYDTLLAAGAHWDRMNGSDYRVDLWPVDINSVGPCASIADNDWIELEVRVADPSKPGWCGTTSCVDFNGPVPTWAPIHNQWGLMYMVASHVPSTDPAEYRRNLSHEAGHVWGLKDPDYRNQYSGGCYSSWGVGYYSVMHQYGESCDNAPYISYPQGADFESVIAWKLPVHN